MSSFVSGAYLDLTTVNKMQPLSNKLTAVKLQSDAIFEYIDEQLKQDPSRGKAVNGVFLYVITKNGKQAKQWSKCLLLSYIIINSTVFLSDVWLVEQSVRHWTLFMLIQMWVSGFVNVFVLHNGVIANIFVLRNVMHAINRFYWFSNQFLFPLCLLYY